MSLELQGSESFSILEILFGSYRQTLTIRVLHFNLPINPMPKLKNKPPKYAKLKNYAVVYLNGKIHYLGLYGSEESKVAYARLVAESRVSPALLLPKEGASVTISELAVAFLDHINTSLKPTSYNHYRTIVGDFLLKLYGGDIPVDDFKPSSLKLVRSEMIQSRRFCRRLINVYTRHIISIFTWGVEEELVQPNTVLALKAVKLLAMGHAGTFDNAEREPVTDELIRRTLPFMPVTLAAMVKLQRLTGCRPSEIFNMRVGEIDRTTDPNLWLYQRPQHKTENKTKRKKVIPLGKIEQELISPYLVGKKPEQAVFSPRTAQEERNAEKRAIRKTKVTPSQAVRDAARTATNFSRYREFYDKNSYRQAVEYAIIKANKNLPEGEQIPHWTPYQIRHTAATAMELEAGLDEAQALLDHSSADTTKRYTHGRLEKLKELARNRQNPFEDSTEKRESAVQKAS